MTSRFLRIVAAIVVGSVAITASDALALQAQDPEPIVAPVHLDTVDPNDAGPQAEDSLSRLFGKKPSELSGPIKIMLLMTVLTFVPSLLLTLTCYTRIIIVLSFARRAIGTPELPPSPILIGLALFLTFGVMAPTFKDVHEQAIAPLLTDEIGIYEAGDRAAAEIKGFLLAQTREEDVLLALDLAKAERPQSPMDTPLSIAVPAFVLSELRTAFRMGFVLFLPFLLIDLVVAAVLLALGMFMLPPTMIAMPLKILVFVLVDGWALVITSLSRSFAPAL